MWVLLPDLAADFSPVDLLAPAVLAEAAATARPRDIHLALPRWDFQTDEPLNETLQGLGMVTPFSGEADFSAAGDLGFIDQVIHRADITVDEKGTEAAAVTGIAMEESAVQVPPLAFEADRPFAFAIVDDTTGAPIFEGVVADPTAG
jgi:serpin B